jgi:hypothetical protein
MLTLQNTMMLPRVNLETNLVIEMIEVETTGDAMVMLRDCGYDSELTESDIDLLGYYFTLEVPEDYDFEMIEHIEQGCLEYLKDDVKPVTSNTCYCTNEGVGVILYNHMPLK